MPTIATPLRVAKSARSSPAGAAAAITVAALIAMAPLGSLGAKENSQDTALPDGATPADPTTLAPDPTQTDPASPIEEILISGEHPGPGLWKVTHGTHVLWIFGSINPAPKNMTWHSDQVEAIVASSKQVLAGENISPNIGFFKGLTLLPSVLRLRFNPDKAALKDMIPPEVYERWLPLRKRYFKDDEDIEKVRPMFIAMMLYQKAIERAGLTRSDDLYRPIFNTAKKNHVPVKEIEVKFDVDDPRQKIRDYAATPRDVDVACLVAAIDRLDDDVSTMQKRAAAWATGDVQALAALPVPVQESACQDAVMSAPGLQDELGTLKNRLLATWLATTSAALAANDVTFMILPVATLLKPDGRLAVLRERGYVVEAPAN